MRILFRVKLVLCVMLLAGCGSTIASAPMEPLPQAMPVDPPPGSTILTANTYAGDAMAAMLLKHMDAGGSIMVAAFTDMENTSLSSPFGRTSMQQVSSRVGQHGFRVLEMRLGENMRINEQNGELILTLDVARLLMQEHNAHAVMVGMYSLTPDKVFVSTRVVRLEDSALIAAYEYYMPYNEEVRSLLPQKGQKPSGASNEAVWNRHAGRGQSFSNAPAPAAKPVALPAAVPEGTTSGTGTVSSSKPIPTVNKAVQATRPALSPAKGKAAKASPSALTETYDTHSDGKVIKP